MNRLALAVPLALFAALAAIFAIVLLAPKPHSASPMVGKMVPSFQLASLIEDGDSLSAADFGQGKPIVVNVFASWCAPCRIEHRLLMNLREAGAVIYGIDYKDKAADAQEFLDELGNPFARVGFDADGRAGIEWGLRGVPETFVVNGEGRIIAHIPGPLDPSIVNEDILPALGLD